MVFFIFSHLVISCLEDDGLCVDRFASCGI
jgi:hypothetical protein